MHLFHVALLDLTKIHHKTKNNMDINIDFFKIKNDKQAAQGRVLISEPFLGDTYFKRSVVLITEHSAEGTVGFVLNKPISVSLQDVIQDFPKFDSEISLGGPVSTNTIHFLHTLGKEIPESVLVKDNIYWGGDFSTLTKLVAEGAVKKDQIRFFLGYSGWSADQLENEIEANAWLVAEIGAQLIMKSEKPAFWHDILKDMDNKYKVWANFPDNPGLN